MLLLLLLHSLLSARRLQLPARTNPSPHAPVPCPHCTCAAAMQRRWRAAPPCTLTLRCPSITICWRAGRSGRRKQRCVGRSVVWVEGQRLLLQHMPLVGGLQVSWMEGQKPLRPAMQSGLTRP